MFVATPPADISKLRNPSTIPTFGTLADVLNIDLLNLIFFIIGFIFFGSLMMASFSYIFSDGSPEKVSKANSRILNSIFGLIIVFTSFVLVRIVTFVFYGKAGNDLLPF